MIFGVLGCDKVRAWERLSQTTIRTDVTWLNRVSDWLNQGLDVVSEGAIVHVKNGDFRIGRIRNEHLLITDHPHNHQLYDFEGVPVGEVINGCQLYRNGPVAFFKRIPDLSGFTDLERQYLTSNPLAHCPQKHGSGVTDEALRFRTETGIAPNGEDGNIVNGTRFYSNAEIKACINQLGPGTPYFNANLNPTGTRAVIQNYDMQIPLGEGFRIGSTSLEGDITKVTAVWWKDETTGGWFLRTMYPVL